MRTAAAKQRLVPALSPGNVQKVLTANLGYGDPAKLYPRLPRLSFEEACSLL